MFSINSLRDVSKFQRGNAAISLLVTDEYSPEIVELLSSQFNRFNARLSSRWHLLIPYKGNSSDLNGSLLSLPVLRSDFDVDLALAIADEYSIPSRKFPAIVFDFSSGAVIFSLPKGREQLKVFFETLAEEINGFRFDACTEGDLRDFVRSLKIKLLRKNCRVEIINAATDPRSFLRLIPLIGKTLERLTS